MGRDNDRNENQKKSRAARRERCFCAFCGNEHRVYVKSHVSFFDIFLCAAVGLIAVAPISGGFDARGLGLGAVFVGVAEIFIGLRHRLSVKCGRCGFDPIIYRKSQDRAAEIVRLHIERRARDPAQLLAGPIVPVGFKRTLTRSKLRSNSSQQL